MNPFSIELESLMREKDIKTYALAQYCGIDRSNMYKVINSKRTPTSEEVVVKMAEYMRLKPSERKSLLESYMVTVMGRDTFYRRKCIEEFLTAFHANTFSLMRDIYVQEFMSVQINKEKMLSRRGDLVTGRQLTALIQSVLTLEAQKEHGHIRLMMQPTGSNVMEMLMVLGEQKETLTIDHIFCLANADTIDAENNDYNLDSIGAIIPMFAQCRCSYYPHCYYDNISAKDDRFNLMSSMIVTSDYAVIFSKKDRYGLLLDSEATIHQLSQKFDVLMEDTRLLAKKFVSLEEQLAGFPAMDFQVPGYDFQPEGCMVPFITPEIVQKYVIPELLANKQLTENVGRYLVNTTASVRNTPGTYLFTESGIRSFLENGRISELPFSLYRPLEPEDRISMVEGMTEFLASGKYKLLKPNSPIELSELCIYASAHDGYIMVPSSGTDRIYISICEASILNAFTDYFENIDPKYVYTPEEGVEVLQKLIAAADK